MPPQKCPNNVGDQLIIRRKKYEPPKKLTVEQVRAMWLLIVAIADSWINMAEHDFSWAVAREAADLLERIEKGETP